VLWNLSDFILVFLGVVETVVPSNRQRGSPAYIRLVRILRVLKKASRLMRILHFFSELRLMVQCILGSMFTLMWAMLALFLVMLIYSIVIVQQMTAYVVEHRDTVSDFEFEDISAGFGSVRNGVLSLLMCASGGTDWGPMYDIVRNAGVFASIAFISYILLMWLSLTNIVTSIFVDKALRNALPHVQDQLFRKREDDLTAVSELQEIFDSMDMDGSNSLSLSEVKLCMEDVRLSTLFELRGLQIKDVELFFHLLCSVSGCSEIDRDSFVMGCLQMKGPASSVDLFSMSHQLKDIGQRVQDQLRYCRSDMTKLFKEMHTISTVLAQNSEDIPSMSSL